MFFSKPQSEYDRGHANAKESLQSVDYYELLFQWESSQWDDDYDRGYHAALTEYARENELD